MPNREVHRLIGMVASAIQMEPHLDGFGSIGQVGLASGALLGGYYASTLPDVIEPASSPRHRSSAHSIALLALLVHACKDHIPSWIAVSRAAAWDAGVRRLSASRCSPEWYSAGLDEFLNGFAAGALLGAGTGYTSHLIADSFTPAGLPLLASDAVT